MPNKPRCSMPNKRPDPTDPTPADAQTAPSESGPFSQAPQGASHDEAPSLGSSNVPTKSEEDDVADVSGVPGCDKAPPSGSSNVSLKSEGEDVDARLNVEKRPVTTSAGAAPSESGPFSQAPPRASHDEASTSGSDPISSIRKDIVQVEDGTQKQASNLRGFPWPNVPGLQKLKKIVSFEPDLQKLQNMLSADVSGIPECYKAPPSGSSNVEGVDARVNVSGPPQCDDGSSSGSSNVPKARSEEASTSGSSNVPNRSEEQDVDFNLNVSGDPRCSNAAPSCSSSSGATKSRSDLLSSIRSDIVEVEDVNLDDLMNHINELLKLREEGTQPQASNLRKFPWPNVPGLQKLKKIVSFGTDLQKLQNMLSAALTVGSELKDIIDGSVTDLLKDIGKVSVASAGLLVVAHTLERFDDVSTNKEKCWHLIKEMSYVASIIKRLKEIPQGMPQFVMEKATSLLVEGAIMCCKQIGGSAWQRVFVASKIKGDLSDIRQKLHAMHLRINTEIGLRLLCPVEREGRSSLSKGYPTYAIGINEQVKEVLGLLEIESDKKAATVILHGLGGMGKTTLAEAVFSEVVGCKCSKVLLFKDINSTPDIIELQKQILQDLVEPGETIPQIRLPADGQRELERVLASVDAFIYIDNVLEASALRMLLPHDITEAKKVRLLLTARDDGVKISCSGTIPKIHKMKLIQDKEAKLILEKKIKEGINDSQFNDIIQACRGIPLMLTLAASFIGVHDNREEAYDTLMREKHKWTGDEFKEIHCIFAYDALPSESKDPFLDICAYFNGWKWDIVQDIVGKDELRMLESRALVTKDTNGVASVHDVILTIARRKSKEESNGKEVRKRFTSACELKKFLEEEDTQGIKGISLARDYGAALHICASRLDSMHNSLRVLHLETRTKVKGNCNEIFKELISLKANIIQLPFHVSQLNQLRYLSCEFPEMPRVLELVNFDGSWQSRAVQVLSTDFIQLRNLRVLIFINFTKLKELPKELGKLVSLRVLKLIGCKSIRKLPEGLAELCNDFRSPPLQIVDVNGCDRLEQFPGDGSCLSTDISVQAFSISESQKENIENKVLSKFDRRLTDGRGEPFHLSHLPPNTPVLVICEAYGRRRLREKKFLWDLIKKTIHKTQRKLQIIYIGERFDKLPKRIKNRIFVIRLLSSDVQKVLKQVCLTLDAAVPSGIRNSYLQMHTKTVGEKSDNYHPCWGFLTEGELEEFVLRNSQRYLQLNRLAETNEESSNIKLLIELFAPGGDETTPVFQKKDSSGQVTTCGVDQLKGKTILLDLRSEQLFDDIGLPSLKEMYDVVVKQKLDFEIISIPVTDIRVTDGSFSRELPWFVFPAGTRAITKVGRFFLTKQCGWEEGDECEKWYASINCIIEPNGRVIPRRHFTKSTVAKNTPILEFLHHLERASDQVKRDMHEEIENFKKKEWEELKSMSTLEFLFNHLESTSDQVKKLMRQGKIICLHGCHDHCICAQLMEQMDLFGKGIHTINVGHLRMKSLVLTDIISKKYYNLSTTPTDAEKMSSLDLSSHELIRFSLRLHYLKEEINRIEESDKKLSELKSVLHSFHDERSMIFMDQYGKVVAILGEKDMRLISRRISQNRAHVFIKSMINDIEGEGKEMHDEDPAVSDSLIQNMQTASVALFERLLEYISELWGVELYQLLKFNKDGKKSSPSRVTWPASRGFLMLENFLSKGTDANWVKDVISQYPEEVPCETVIKSLLKDIEEKNWGLAGLLGVAHVLERFESVSANQKEKCLVVLDDMLGVAQYIKQLSQKPGLWRRIKHAATVSIVIFSIVCSALIDPSKFALFDLATVDKYWLGRIESEIDWAFGDNIAEVITDGPDGLDALTASQSECMCNMLEMFFETSW